MSGLHAVPSAADLVAACLDELRHVVPSGPAGFRLRVVVMTLELIERELRADGSLEAAHARRLASLGFDSELELALAIRSGAVSDADLPQVREAALADVVARLQVVNPGYEEGYA